MHTGPMHMAHNGHWNGHDHDRFARGYGYGAYGWGYGGDWDYPDYAYDQGYDTATPGLSEITTTTMRPPGSYCQTPVRSCRI